MFLTFWLSICIILFTYLIYPLFIWVLGAVFYKEHTIDPNNLVAVTLIIPAYNEEKFIEEKILNSLASNYPADKLEIIISSDNSTDKTAEIVGKYTSKRIKFHDFKKRSGKMGVLNKTVPLANGDILVFTDANALFDKDAIRNMVRHFTDKNIGCVSGAKIITQGDSSTAKGEGIYWRWESFLKKQESRFSSCVGADGAVYAIRKELYSFPSDDKIIMDDFSVSLKIIADGYRCIYDPEVKAYEESATGIIDEFRRKGRIFAGSITVLSGMKNLLWPGSPIFLQLWSHKVLRWFSILFMGTAFLSNVFLADRFPYQAVLFVQSLFYLCVAIGFGFDAYGQRKPLFYIPFYFFLINLSQLFGLIAYLGGDCQPTWEKTKR
jgi:cellulose synthase/poly-beta-1,6-N-acetylglucosamine synthase-like glycosyltransferase